MKKCDSDRCNYCLRMQVSINSSQALLLQHFSHHYYRVFSHREMVITAIIADRLVFSDRDQFGFVVSDAGMQHVIRDFSYRLNHQAHYLQTCLIGQPMEQIQTQPLPYLASNLTNSSFQELPGTYGCQPNLRQY